MKKFLALALFGATAVAGVSAPALSEACRCQAPRPVADRLETTDAVFYGKVTSVTSTGDENTGTHTHTFAVRRVWKGELSATIRVRTNQSSAACGTRFTRGASYLIFASKQGRSWHTGVCSGNLSGGGAAAAANQLGPR